MDAVSVYTPPARVIATLAGAPYVTFQSPAIAFLGGFEGKYSREQTRTCTKS
jgi:hypothetical protein